MKPRESDSLGASQTFPNIRVQSEIRTCSGGENEKQNTTRSHGELAIIYLVFCS